MPISPPPSIPPPSVPPRPVPPRPVPPPPIPPPPSILTYGIPVYKCVTAPPATKKIRVSKWYFGGIAGVGATLCTHPLDLIKVHFQTQQEGKFTIFGQIMQIIRRDGFLRLYRGVTPAILRALTYTTTRIGIYEVGKEYLTPNGEKDLSFHWKVALAGTAGAIGAIFGAPADLVKIRMQSDLELPPEKRRNYKNALDGLIKSYREERSRNLWVVPPMTVLRSSVSTIGQLCTYDQIKTILVLSWSFEDGFPVHFLSSVMAGTIATFLTQPLDVLKTRKISAKPGEIRSTWSLVKYTARLGPAGFFKGFVPAFLRLGPHTVIMFEIIEQLRKNFGTVKEVKA